jgi:dipeptidyl aminopeptidase/acylaminoacyl peptidase
VTLVHRGVRVAWLGGLSALLLCSLLVQSAGATFRGHNGRIAWSVFSAGGGGGGGFQWLKTLSGSGGNRRMPGYCAEDEMGNLCGKWENITYSPDGRHLLWDEPDASGRRVIVVANSDASSPQVVDNDPANDSQASYAPAGQRIVYVRQVGDAGGQFGTLVTSDLSGMHLHVVSSTVQASEPLFMPDGRRILFIRSSDEGLWSINANGGGLRRIIRRVATFGITFDISPGGNQIAYVGHDGNLYMTSANGTGRHRVVGEPDGSDPIDGVRFSPDGKVLLLGAQSPTTPTRVGTGETLYRVPVEAGKLRVLSRSGDTRAVTAGLSWQPLH